MRSLFRFSAAVAAIAIAAAGLPSAAMATYAGRPGAQVYQNHNTGLDNQSNELTADYYSLTQAGALHALLSCAIGNDTGSDRGGPVCPVSGVSFSPSGAKLVFAGAKALTKGRWIPRGFDSCSGWCPTALFTATLSGPVRSLPVALVDAEHPEFMPSGRTIVFAGRTAKNARDQLYTVNLHGGGLRQITTAGGTNPAPCANGKVVYNRGNALYELNASLRSSRRLTTGSLADCSPNSHTIAFLRHSTLYTASLTGSHVRRLTAPGAALGRPAFSPAGDQIAYVAAVACSPNGCPPPFANCSSYADELTVASLTGDVVSQQPIGSASCPNDHGVTGLDGTDLFGQVAWQPIPAQTPK